MDRPRQRTKIVATVGPACAKPQQLAKLALAGVDVFRLNLAHGDLDEHAATIRAVRGLAREIDKICAVLVDLAGPKIRLGTLPGGSIELASDDTVRLVRGDSVAAGEFITSYDRLLDEIKPGQRVLLADGQIGLTVEEVARDHAVLRVGQGGLVREHQGIAVPGAGLSLPTLTERDRECAQWAARQDVDFVGLSFVRQPSDVMDLRKLLASAGSAAHIVSKIERQDALARLDEIIAASDAVMVARGDLGVEIDVARIAVVQKQIVARCQAYSKPVIIATQMLESMQHAPRPTRAEATDVANAIFDGCDACMLSGETAIGDYPREAVETMARIALATEDSLRDRPLAARPVEPVAGLKPVTDAIVFGVDQVAERIHAALVAVVSHSGATARALSKQKSFIPMIGLSDNEHALRRMCLYWGVVPLAGAPVDDREELLAFVERQALAKGWGRAGDYVVQIAGGSLPGGGHNILGVFQITGTNS